MLFLQMALVFVISGQQAPWFVKPVIQGFVNTVKVGRRSCVFKGNWALIGGERARI
jgi:hypothetical protein